MELRRAVQRVCKGDRRERVTVAGARPRARLVPVHVEGHRATAHAARGRAGDGEQVELPRVRKQGRDRRTGPVLARHDERRERRAAELVERVGGGTRRDADHAPAGSPPPASAAPGSHVSATSARSLSPASARGSLASLATADRSAGCVTPTASGDEYDAHDSTHASNTERSSGNPRATGDIESALR